MDFQFSDMNGQIPGNGRSTIEDFHHPHLFNHVRQKTLSNHPTPDIENREGLDERANSLQVNDPDLCTDLDQVNPEKDRLILGRPATICLNLPNHQVSPSSSQTVSANVRTEERPSSW